MKHQASRVPGRLHKGALASRIDHLSQSLGCQEEGDPEYAARKLHDWVLSDPEARALSLELYRRASGRPERDPTYAVASVSDLVKRFDARLLAAPNARALMKTLALAPRGRHAP